MASLSPFFSSKLLYEVCVWVSGWVGDDMAHMGKPGDSFVLSTFNGFQDPNLGGGSEFLGKYLYPLNRLTCPFCFVL